MTIIFSISGVQPINKEVLTATDATVSCVITGITQQIDAVVWRKSGTDVTSLSGSNYVVSAGTYGSNSQTTTLTVKAAANTADSTYTCAITSNEWLQTNKETNVLLSVFGKDYPFAYLETLSIFIICNSVTFQFIFEQFSNILTRLYFQPYNSSIDLSPLK